MVDYIRIPWVNGTAPAINATNLNHMDVGIFNATEAIKVIESTPPPTYTLPPATDTTLGGVKVKVDTTNPDLIVGEIYVS